MGRGRLFCNAEICPPCATRISFKAYQTLEPSRVYRWREMQVPSWLRSLWISPLSEAKNTLVHVIRKTSARMISVVTLRLQSLTR